MAARRLVLDSGALSAIAEKEGPLRAFIRKALIDGSDVFVPTVVVAESITGDGTRDANVNQFLKRVQVAPLDEKLARSAAVLRHAQRRFGAGTIDAAVVATADAVPGTRVITGDPDDLRLLAAIAGNTLVVGLDAV